MQQLSLSQLLQLTGDGDASVTPTSFMNLGGIAERLVNALKLFSISLGVIFALPAVGQEVAIRQEGAGGRFETQLDPKSAVPSFPASRVAGFRARVDRLAGMLRNMPEAAMPPAPVCHRLKSWIESNPRHGVLAAEIGVMSPISFTNGRCHRMTGTGVVFRLNALSLLLDPQQAHVRSEGGHGDWWLLPPGVAERQVIDLGDRVAFTHGRAPLLTPVSTGRYLQARIDATPAGAEGGAEGELQRWLNGGKAKMLAENAARLDDMKAYLKPADLTKMADAMQVVVDSTETELRRAANAPQVQSDRETSATMLASLSAAEKAAPACLFVHSGEPDISGNCQAGNVLYELNPRYFDTARPDTVQLIVMETPDGRTHGESDERLAARQVLWRALDRPAIAALVE